MKKILLSICLLVIAYSMLAQTVTSFTWTSRHYFSTEKPAYNYISSFKNQRDQGACGIFASVAAVEAMTQIYFNRNGASVNLAESYIYNSGDGNCLGDGCGEMATSATGSLAIMKNSGIVDEDCFPFPTQEPWCKTSCSGVCPYPTLKIQIPDYSQITIPDAAALRLAIMDYGPIIVKFANSYAGCYLHPTDIYCNYTHVVLLVGWQSTNNTWEIKDSWPNNPQDNLYSSDINIFNYSPTFYRVWAETDSQHKIVNLGSDNTLTSSRFKEDRDGDGFYNWGLESLDKPANCIGPNKMDFDDGNRNVIFRDGFNVLSTPTISGPSRVCQNGGDRTFELSYVPTGFTCSWYISNNSSCFNTSSGNGSSVTLYPNSTCIGKESEVTFRITQNGDGGYAEYKKSFFVNCPREDLTSLSVLDSYGGSPPKYGDTYYLCPYTTYNIFYNEYDNDCNVTITDWDLPSGWSKHYDYNNMVSIYTNDWPDGFLYIKGTTSCNSAEVTLMSAYFGAAECGGYFLAYPNPSGSFVDIDVDKAKIIAENVVIEGECILSLVDKAGIIKFKTKFKGFPFRLDTSNLPEGLYFVNITHKGKPSTIRLVIKH